MRQGMYDQAMKAVETLEYLVDRLGIYVAGSPEEIKRQLEKFQVDEALAGSRREIQSQLATPTQVRPGD